MRVSTRAKSIRQCAVWGLRRPATVMIAAALAVSCAGRFPLMQAKPAQSPPPSQSDQATSAVAAAARPASAKASPLSALLSIPPLREIWGGSGPPEPASTMPLSVTQNYPGLAEVIFRVVEATEEKEPALHKLDQQVKEIDHEISQIRGSEGWVVEVASRRTVVDGTRRDRRAGWTQRLDGDFREPYDLYGDLDQNETEFLIRLKRSFLGPDHEKYVRIALKRLNKMDTAIDKQRLRRAIHQTTLQAILDVLYRQTVLPAMDRQIALAKETCDLLKTYQEVGEVLRKDVLEAEGKLATLGAQRQVQMARLNQSLETLRQRTGDPALALPTTLPLVLRPLPPAETFDAERVTSYALQGRFEYRVGQWQVRLAETMAYYMAWYWPDLDFEVFWNRFHGHQTWLDEFRRDKGREFGMELALVVPLNLPRLGWARHKQLRAACDAYALDLEVMRNGIRSEVAEAYLDWMEADLQLGVARRDLEQAREALRLIELKAERLPEGIVGKPKIAWLDARLDVEKAQAAVYLVEHALFLAQTHWDYLVGDSPIDYAVEPYEARDSRALAKANWLRWWVNLTE